MVSWFTALFSSASTYLSAFFGWLGTWKTEILLWLAHRKGKQTGRKDAEYDDMKRKLNDIDKANNAINDDEFLDWVREQQRASSKRTDNK